MSRPCGVSTDSGWNCTPSSGSSRWRTAITSPSAAVADTSNTSDYPGSIEEQTHQVMRNLTTVLSGCGLGLQDVAAVRVFLRHFDEDYARMNAVYATYFPAGRRPARTCVGVTGLARGARVEIDLIARRP